MSAPGMNLEFESTRDFIHRSQPIQGLEMSVVRAIQISPAGQSKVAAGIYHIEVNHGPKVYLVFFGRRQRSNKIGLIAIFDVEQDAKLIREKEAELKQRYR